MRVSRESSQVFDLVKSEVAAKIVSRFTAKASVIIVVSLSSRFATTDSRHDVVALIH